MKESVSRRAFVSRGLALTAASATTGFLSSQSNAQEISKDFSSQKVCATPLFVSTWPFGRPANDVSLKTFENGGSLLDAVEAGIKVPEADPGNGSVGYGGLPNAHGVVQLDACIMYGPGHQGGSVTALEGFKHPISVARRVMEKTRHVMLTGQGAAEFAASQGFEKVDLLTEERRKAWERWAKENPEAAQLKADENQHDTIALLGLAPDGTIAGGCSTSGLAFKMPGRVGDSPILGSGLYVDNEVGAAGATGIGENIMRYCGSFMVVEYMRQGLHPEEACLETVKRIARMDPRSAEDLSIFFVALDKQGRYGAAGSGGGFSYAVTNPNMSEVFKSSGVSSSQVKVEGGNQEQL